MRDIKTLASYLNSISNSIAKDIATAQRETAESIRGDTQSLAPKGTGKYADSIKVSKTKITSNNIETLIYTDSQVISSKGKSYNLGFLLENGTAPHMIYPVNAKALHFVIGGEDIFTKYVKHPGFKAMPHFIPALNKNKSLYLKKIGSVCDKEFK